MRFIQAVLFLIFLGAVGLFAVQNMETISVTFWTWKLTAPVALVSQLVVWLVLLVIRLLRRLRLARVVPRSQIIGGLFLDLGGDLHRVSTADHFHLHLFVQLHL